MNAFEKGVTKMLIAQLSELYFCENQLVHALERMAEAARNQELKDLFLTHRKETMGHIGRLEAAFSKLNEPPRVYPCRIVEGLLEDGTWMMHTMKGEATLDLALIEAAHKTEMVEAASYRSAMRLARQLGHENVAQLCESNLEEELQADEKLTELSKHFEGEHA